MCCYVYLIVFIFIDSVKNSLGYSRINILFFWLKPYMVSLVVGFPSNLLRIRLTNDRRVGFVSLVTRLRSFYFDALFKLKYFI